MNLKQIIEDFDEKFNDYYGTPDILPEESIKQFISTSITQLLEELREPNVKAPGGPAKQFAYDEDWYKGYNKLNQILNDKIDKILNNK